MLAIKCALQIDWVKKFAKYAFDWVLSGFNLFSHLLTHVDAWKTMVVLGGSKQRHSFNQSVSHTIC